MKVLVGSKNRVKIEAAKEAFEEYFDNVDAIGLPADSNVPDQPVNEDIYKGARNRVDNLIKYAKENKVDADYFAAIESGITNGLLKIKMVLKHMVQVQGFLFQKNMLIELLMKI